MNDLERFELLWAHYQRQIDENRAVSRHLDYLDKKINDLNLLVKDIFEYLNREK
jgi:phosphoribulokinase